MVNKVRIDRRTCLTGLGVALALPLLETMGWADPGKGQTVQPPVPAAVMDMPHCTFRSPTQPVPAETNPRSVLNRLFGKTGEPGQTGQPGPVAKADPLDGAMLDLVLGGARDLRRKLSKDDQHKLDEYLDSVRSV